jgi:exodeoxyribonuclease VII small subunit
MSAPAKTNESEISFEKAMGRLEEIVADMEGEGMSLEDMVKNYEEGVKLLRICRQRIDTAKQRVELITADLEGGKASLSPFDQNSASQAAKPEADTDEDDDAKPSSRARRKPDPPSDDIRLF